MSKEVYTIMLRPHEGHGGLMLYQAKAKNYNAAVLRMRVQGIVPAFDIVSYSSKPGRSFVLGVMFPKLSVKDGEKPKGWKVYLRPVLCWLKRNHDYIVYQKHGRTCRRCFGVFPAKDPEVKK